MPDYTKGHLRNCLTACLAAALLLALGAGPQPAAAQPANPFEGWHLPLPAGQWLISRGPCGAAGAFTHQCGYYEDHCAIDLTPLAGSMENVPVLAPQAGQVFFLGTRADSGLTVMLYHDDGRVSALMHLARVVVGLDQRVAQGQVVGYAGNSGSSTRPHLHFHVQPNAVQRECLPLNGLDDIDFVRLTATSHNLAWTELTLIDPPADLPAWLPLLAAEQRAPSVLLPQRAWLRPGGEVALPVAVANTRLGGTTLRNGRQVLEPALRTDTHTVFMLPLAAPEGNGDYRRLLRLQRAGARLGQALRYVFSVRPPAETSPAESIVLISPTFAGPPNWSMQTQPPRLCWTEPDVAGAPPLLFRVMVVGPAAADSGWMPDMCWQTPDSLPPGTYYWKVFVRDGNGYMNRTNQRPFVFELAP